MGQIQSTTCPQSCQLAPIRCKQRRHSCESARFGSSTSSDAVLCKCLICSRFYAKFQVSTSFINVLDFHEFEVFGSSVFQWLIGSHASCHFKSHVSIVGT